MDVQNTSLFVLILSLVLILLDKNERYNAVESFKNKTEFSKMRDFLGNKLVDYKNVKLKNFGFNSEVVNSLLFTPNKGPVALANGDIKNTGQIQIKLDKKYEITGLIIRGIKKFSMKYYCEVSKKFKPIYGPKRNSIFINKDKKEFIINRLETKSGLAVISNQVNIYNLDDQQTDGIKFQLYGMPVGNTIKKFLKLGYEIPLQILNGSKAIDTVSNLYKGQIIKDKIINLSSKSNDNFIVKSLSFNSNINKFKLFYKSKNDKEYKVIDTSLEILGSHDLNETFKYYFKHPILMNKLVLVVLSTVNDSANYLIKNVKLFVESQGRSRQIDQNEIDSVEAFQNSNEDTDQELIVELNKKCELLNLYDKNKNQEKITRKHNQLLKQIQSQEMIIDKLNGELANLTNDFTENEKINDTKSVLEHHNLMRGINNNLGLIKENNLKGDFNIKI